MWQTKQNRHLPNAVWLARLDVWLCDLVAVAVCAVSVHLPAYACECCIRMWSSAFVCACLCVCCLCSCRAASFDSVATNYRGTHTHSEYVCWPLSCAAVWHSYVIWTHRMAVDCWLMYCKNLFWYSIHWLFWLNPFYFLAASWLFGKRCMCVTEICIWWWWSIHMTCVCRWSLITICFAFGWLRSRGAWSRNMGKYFMNPKL